MDKLVAFGIETIGHRMAQAVILDIWVWTALCVAVGGIFVGSAMKALWEELRREFRGF